MKYISNSVSQLAAPFKPYPAYLYLVFSVELQIISSRRREYRLWNALLSPYITKNQNIHTNN